MLLLTFFIDIARGTLCFLYPIFTKVAKSFELILICGFGIICRSHISSKLPSVNSSKLDTDIGLGYPSLFSMVGYLTMMYHYLLTVEPSLWPPLHFPLVKGVV